MSTEISELPPTLSKALCAARAQMSKMPLPRSETGYDDHGKAFFYPSEQDLQAASDMVLDNAGLDLIPRGAAFAAAVLTTSWTLYHLDSGEQLQIVVAWPVFEDRGHLTRAHASGGTWSHAWRHMVCKLLRVRVESAPVDPRQLPLRPTRQDPLAGPVAAWMADAPAEPAAAEPATPIPWRAQQRLAEEAAKRSRMTVTPDAQWSSVGAVVEPAPPMQPPTAPPFEAEVLTVWADLCDAFRGAGVPKRWDSCLAAWKEFAGEDHEHDVLAPNDSAFKRWMVQLANQWIDEKADATKRKLAELDATFSGTTRKGPQ